MIKICSTSKRNLKLICDKHYEGVEKILLDGLKKSNFNRIIKEEIHSKLRAIVKAEPLGLLILEVEVMKFIMKYRSNVGLIKHELRRIFDYEAFTRRNPTSKWGCYQLADSLLVNTCVYCNRQYTFTVSNGRRKVTRPQFDHYFSQEEHPMLRLSFYNLIPCCSICNLMKQGAGFSMHSNLHPYLNEFGDEGVFTYLPKDYKSMIGKSDNMEIKILVKNHGHLGDAIVNQKNFFHLDDIYGEHADIVQEVVWKRHVAKGSYLKWFKEKFGVGLSKEEIYRISIGNYIDPSELDRRVLSKLTRDIALELGISS